MLRYSGVVEALLEEKKKCPDVVSLYDNSCVTHAEQILIFTCYCSRRAPTLTIFIFILSEFTVLNVNAYAEK